jgi:hypothetical protein
MSFEAAKPAATGRPSYHPSVLLKLYIYGYLNRVQSSPRLEREALTKATLTIAQLFLYWHLAYFFEIANASRALGCKIGSCRCSAFANAWEQVLCCPNHFRLLRRVALYNPNFPGEPDKCRRRKWCRSKAPSPGRRLGSLPEQLPDEASCETYASLRFVTGR